MKAVRILLWVVVAAIVLVVAVVVGFFVLKSTDRTDCFASFNTQTAADRASELGEEAGFDVDIDHRRPTFFALTFETGETGDDAAELRQAFRRIVAEQDGDFGHPGGGCLEKPYFD